MGIGFGGIGDRYIGDKVHCGVHSAIGFFGGPVRGFGDLQLIANPVFSPLLAPAGFHVMGRHYAIFTFAFRGFRFEHRRTLGCHFKILLEYPAQRLHLFEQSILLLLG